MPDSDGPDTDGARGTAGRSGTLAIHQIPVLSDNYVYLAHDPDTGATAVIDPAVAAPVLRTLEEFGWRLTHILNTHHHGDHVGGNLELIEKTGCTVVGPGHDADRIPGIAVRVREGDRVTLGRAEATVIEVAGHTRGHIAYHFAEDRVLFCGDTLFSAGCGRLFEGSPAQMWDSLKKLRALPEDTRVYCAHEYTQKNTEFALSVDPDNAALREYAAAVRQLRRQDRPTVPSRLSTECAVNPFLRVDQPDLGAALGMERADPVTLFAEIRSRRDVF